MDRLDLSRIGKESFIIQSLVNGLEQTEKRFGFYIHVQRRASANSRGEKNTRHAMNNTYNLPIPNPDEAEGHV